MFLTTKERALMQYVVKQVSKVFGPPVMSIMYGGRHRPYVRARHSAIYILLKSRRYSCLKISTFFGYDPATILHAKDSIERRLKDDPDFERKELQEQIQKTMDEVFPVLHDEKQIELELDTEFAKKEEDSTEIVEVGATAQAVQVPDNATLSVIMQELRKLQSMVTTGAGANEMARRGTGYIREARVPIYRCMLQPKDDELLEEYGAWFSGHWAVRTDSHTKNWSWAVKACLQVEVKNFQIIFIEPK